MMNEPAKLRYDQGCLGAHALNAVGDRWALLVVRELMFRPKRFQEIRAGLPDVTAAVLTTRLRQLQGAGIVVAEAGAYALTPLGQGLLPVLISLCVWALRLPGHDPLRFISPSALMISMLSTQAPGAGRFVIGFDMGERFTARMDGDLRITAGTDADEGAVLHGTGNHLAAAVYGCASLDLLEQQGFLSVTGDRAAAQDFVAHFSLLPKP
ncbi:MAG: helix-turn-helix domain-containing protein [Paracoccus sp. (in: a-proteobacteria)]|nr:helix-turn-helix domain-containing protein [Paracoccus sp. (in: a-proteobacteria)]